MASFMPTFSVGIGAGLRRRVLAAFAVLALMSVTANGFAFTYGPSVGTYNGGTSVVAKMDTTVAEGAVIYCRFGDSVVPAGSLFMDGSQPAVTCSTPPASGEGPDTVSFAISLDGGDTYSTGGDFHYFTPPTIRSISPSGGSMMGGTVVTVGLYESMSFAADFDPATVTVPAYCKFDNSEVMATYSTNGTITCMAPPSDVGASSLRVSLNGQEYSANMGTFTYLFTNNEAANVDTTSSMYTRWFQNVPVGFYNFYGFYNDFYGMEMVPPQPFYDLSESSPFYFYEPFYEELIPEALVAGPITELCVSSASPTVGPVTGGTRVTIKLAGTVPEDHRTFYCKFGSEVVLADSFFFTEDTFSPAIMCTAPPARTTGYTEILFSLNGEDFTLSGVPFDYHDEIKLDALTPSSTMETEGVTVRVDFKAPYPFDYTVDAERVSLSARCKFDNIEVAAEYLNPDSLHEWPRVICVAAGVDFGVVDVAVSLDGQHWSENKLKFTFEYLDPALPEGDKKQTEEFTVWDGFYGYYSFYDTFYFYDLPFYDAGLGLAPPVFPDVLPPSTEFHTLEFMPEYCYAFELGEAADPSASDIALFNTAGDQSEKDISPLFRPDRLVYYTESYSIHEDVGITVTPTNKYATVKVGGMVVPTMMDEMNITSATTIVGLVVGENRIEVEIVAANGVTQRFYTVVVMVIADTRLVALEHSAPSQAAFVPDFHPLTYVYDLTVSVSVTEIAFTPTSSDPDAVIMVGGMIVGTGMTSANITLALGENLVEITVTSPHGPTAVYTIIVTRSEDGSADDEATGITVPQYLAISPAFSAATLSYTLNVPATCTGKTPTIYESGAGVACPAVGYTTFDNECTNFQVCVGTLAVQSFVAATHSLVFGQNLLTFTITSENFANMTTYTINFYVADNILQNLDVYKTDPSTTTGGVVPLCGTPSNCPTGTEFVFSTYTYYPIFPSGTETFYLNATVADHEQLADSNGHTNITVIGPGTTPTSNPYGYTSGATFHVGQTWVILSFPLSFDRTKNLIRIIVRGPSDGPVTAGEIIYNIYPVRQSSQNLTSAQVWAGENTAPAINWRGAYTGMSPFTPGTYNYTGTVTAETRYLVVAVTREDPLATVTATDAYGNACTAVSACVRRKLLFHQIVQECGAHVASETYTFVCPVKPPASINYIRVRVTASDNIDSATYLFQADLPLSSKCEIMDVWYKQLAQTIGPTWIHNSYTAALYSDTSTNLHIGHDLNSPSAYIDLNKFYNTIYMSLQPLGYGTTANITQYIYTAMNVANPTGPKETVVNTTTTSNTAVFTAYTGGTFSAYPYSATTFALTKEWPSWNYSDTTTTFTDNRFLIKTKSQDLTRECEYRFDITRKLGTTANITGLVVSEANVPNPEVLLIAKAPYQDFYPPTAGLTNDGGVYNATGNPGFDQRYFAIADVGTDWVKIRITTYDPDATINITSVGASTPPPPSPPPPPLSPP
eukprot:CAMPEP_0182871092 /NCGR_PEP_ID=MMETSP0034_2-20130328/10912_1 /TAXON_ID=156128 /ORGANISM="Nephroselmis pyriformis, Strain CCMP717" /LENGTH=1468 /DNA_ID=CAMNT_0025003619 /DNA_START=146 /DNA_END=4549 /DNA_ORIENTATION=+